MVLVVEREGHPKKNSNLFRGSVEIARELDSSVVALSSRIARHSDSLPNGMSTPLPVEKIYSAKNLRKVGFAGVVGTLLSSAYRTFRVVTGAKSQRREMMMNYVSLGIRTGDVVYDNAIRKDLAFIRFRRNARRLFILGARARFAISWFRKISAKEDVRAVCVSSLAPLEASVLARAAVSAGIPVFVGGGKLFVRCDSFDELVRGYHYLSDEGAAGVPRDTNWGSTVDDYLKRRFSEFSQTTFPEIPGSRDLEEAFRERKVVDLEHFFSLGPLATTATKPIVIVSAHCFSDYPHLSGDLLFLDHFEAFTQTLEIISHNDAVNWVIKPHPLAHQYGEAGLVERIVGEKTERHKNLSLWPSQVSMLSALNWAHGFVTVNGTIGMEAACFGKPVLLGGSSSYGHLGFSIAPSTKEEYRAHLMNAQNWGTLSQEQINLARRALYQSHNLGAENDPGTSLEGYYANSPEASQRGNLSRLARGEVRKVWM